MKDYKIERFGCVALSDNSSSQIVCVSVMYMYMNETMHKWRWVGCWFYMQKHAKYWNYILDSLVHTRYHQVITNNHINKHKIQYMKRNFCNNYLKPENLLANIKSIAYNFPINHCTVGLMKFQNHKCLTI